MPSKPVRRTGKKRTLSHLDARGNARMVDVSAKATTVREAVARGEVRADAATIRQLVAGRMPKGDVVAAARIAGIMAAKRTAELVPLCHPLPLTGIEVDVTPDVDARSVRLESRVRLVGKTGAEIEALVAVSIAAVTVYDMCKSIDRGMVIGEIRLVAKSGGKSGAFVRAGESD
jgi:cyclic pyranopterin phosphate synthase